MEMTKVNTFKNKPKRIFYPWYSIHGIPSLITSNCNFPEKLT